VSDWPGVVKQALLVPMLFADLLFSSVRAWFAPVLARRYAERQGMIARGGGLRQQKRALI